MTSSTIGRFEGSDPFYPSTLEQPHRSTNPLSFIQSAKQRLGNLIQRVNTLRSPSHSDHLRTLETYCPSTVSNSSLTSSSSDQDDLLSLLPSHQNSSPPTTTLGQIAACRALHRKIPHEGYPLRRSLWNEFGGGFVTGAATATAIPIAQVSAWAVGLAGYTTRTLELLFSVMLNQREATKRCNARLAVETQNQAQKRDIKLDSANQLLNSRKYDFFMAAATVGTIATAIVGGPVAVMIALGGAAVLAQATSKFMEMAKFALRFVNNSDEQIEERIRQLNEPLSAYEMSLEILATTVGFAISFGAIAALHVFAPFVALPVSIGFAVVGLGIMLQAKSKFKKEADEATEAHAEQLRTDAWNEALQTLLEDYSSFQAERTSETVNAAEKSHRIAKEIKQTFEAHGLSAHESMVEQWEQALTEQLSKSASEQMAAKQLDNYLSSPFNQEAVSLKGWSLQALAELFHAAMPKDEVSRVALQEWLQEQMILEQDIALSSNRH